MQKIGIYQDGSRTKIAALNEQKLIERLDQPSHFSDEEWPGLVVSGIEGGRVLVRHIESPLKKKRALEKTLPFQLENLIPFSLDEIVVRPIYQIGKEKTEATFFVASQEALEKHILSLEGVDPSWVSCTPMALCRFASFTGQDKEDLIVFHAGRQATEVVSIIRGMIQHNISLGIGIEHLEAAYQKDRPTEEDSERIHLMRRLNLSALDQKEYPHLFEMLQEFRREVDRAFCFLSHKEKVSELKSLLFAGETETTFQIEDWLKSWEAFSYTVLPIEGHRGYDPNMVKAYAIPIGLALDALKQDQKSVQFRQGDWVAPEVYAQIKRKVIKGVSLCLVSAAVLFIVGHLVYSKKEEAFKEEISQFVKIYKKEIPTLTKVSLYQTPQEKIHFLNRNIKVMKSDYRYFSPPPLVADVLAFLSDHPKLSRQEGEKKIEINHLRYELLEYPSIQEPFQSYKVKISIVFTSPESGWAREFHDAMIEEVDWIDQEGEITWAREQNAYTLSFILK